MSAPDPGVQRVMTSGGPAHVRVFAGTTSSNDCSAGTLLLGHGAGGGRDAADLRTLTRLTEDAWTVVLVDQPWRVAGRQIATAPSSLDSAWLEVVQDLGRRGCAPDGTALPRPWVYGGRSAGARVACRTSVTDGFPAPGVAAVLCLSFPLHPPGRVERSRAQELTAVLRAGLPTLVVNGHRDPMGTPAQIAGALTTAQNGAGGETGSWAGLLSLHEVPGAHSPSRDLDLVLARSRAFLQRLDASVAPSATRRPGNDSRAEEPE